MTESEDNLLLIIEIFTVWTINSHNHLHRLFEMLDFLPKSMQVEIVSDVVMVYFNKELVAL